MVSERKVFYSRVILFCLSSSRSYIAVCSLLLFVTLLYQRKKSLTEQKYYDYTVLHPYEACACLNQFFLNSQNRLKACLCLFSMRYNDTLCFDLLLYILCESFFLYFLKKISDAMTSQDYPLVGYQMTLDNFSPSDYLNHSKATSKKTFPLALSRGLRASSFLFNQCFNVVQLE